MSHHGTPLSVARFAGLSSAVLKALPRDIDPDAALNWELHGAALKSALHQALVGGAVEEAAAGLLRYQTIVYVDFPPKLNIEKFFFGGKRPIADQELRTSVLPFVITPPVEDWLCLKMCHITRPAEDVEIMSLARESREMPLWCVAALIMLQLARPRGYLSSDSYYRNLFYIGGQLVIVLYDNVLGQWFVHLSGPAFRDGWHKGDRLFLVSDDHF